jgi:hypothetical protein
MKMKMKIKKFALLTIFLSMALLSYGIIPVLGQEDNETEGIETVIKNYLNSFVQQDLDSLMSQLSPNYSHVDASGNRIDYIKFKESAKYYMGDVFKRVVDLSFSDLKFTSIDVQDNKATAEIEFIGKGFNLDTLKERTEKQERTFFLTKEGGVWKIIDSLIVIPQSGIN